MVYFVPSTLGFIPEEWKSDGTYTKESWPADAVLLSQSDSDKFWKKSAPEGKILGSMASGQPCWVSTPKKPDPTKQDIELFRLRAYADPLLGSDRYFSEATRMQIMEESGFEEVRDRAIARFEEIQAQYPWPTK